MDKKRILLMYISENSGHHSASLAIANAFHELSDNVEILNVNSFNYTNPILEKVVNRAYMSIIKRKPEVWGYLYDNPKVIRNTQKLRDAIHRYNSGKAKALIDSFRPDAVICTQAFPCGIMADYKKTYGGKLVLSGALTDYAPHFYWIYDNVDVYFVPSEEAKERFVSNGVSSDRIKITGIPIDPKFKNVSDRKKVAESLGLSEEKPVILIMGGSQGIGPIKEIMRNLNNSGADFQIIVVSGGNKKLQRFLKKAASRINKKTIVLGYVTNVDELMEISSLIITKPGGITISESLAKGLPILIIKPIPGQEEMNTRYLVKNRLAIKIDNPQDTVIFVEELLSKPISLKNLQERARKFSRPESALSIARDILDRIA